MLNLFLLFCLLIFLTIAMTIPAVICFFKDQKLYEPEDDEVDTVKLLCVSRLADRYCLGW